MEPITMGIVALSLAGAGMAAAGSLQQTSAQSQASMFNAKQQQEKAGLQELQTKEDVKRTEREQRYRRGQAIAQAGALGGVEGSTLDILASNAVQEELDLLTIKQQGEVAKKDLLTGARLDVLEAQNLQASGKIGAASTLLTGIGSAAYKASSLK